MLENSNKRNETKITNMNKLTKAQHKLRRLIEDADNILETPVNRAAAEAKLRELGATDAYGQFIQPNPNPGFDEVFIGFL